MKFGFLQLVPHHHTAKLKPHSHTSYAGLTFVLILAGVVLAAYSWSASAAVPAENPQSGSVGLSGTVRGPAPSTAAVIVSPRPGSRTSSTPITVSGICPTQTFVSITKNGVFAGATPCLDDGTFSLQTDLFSGSNDLVAQVTDALGQSGPNSATVTVFYDAPSFALPGGAVGRQLFIDATTSVVGGNPGQQLKRTARIVGGTGPYALNWEWGDNQSSLVSQAGDGPVSASHVYTKPGVYLVILRVTDSLGNAAYLQLVTIVNGPADPLGSTRGGGTGALSGNLIAAWPLYILVFTMVLFFWLGERRQAHKMAVQNQL